MSSLLNHKIRRNGGTSKTLEAWGIAACLVTHRLGGEDAMKLVVDADLTTAPIFEAFDVIELLDWNGTRRFKGRVIDWEPQADAASGRESQTFTIEGPWSYLREVVYQQLHKFPEDPEDLAAGLTNELSARVILHRSPTTGGAVTLRNQVKDALDKAITAGAPIAYDLGELPLTLQPPEDQALDQRCSDVIRRELQWAPHIACRWDYSGSTPELQFADTTAEAEADSFGFRSLDVEDVTSFRGRPRWDLLCPVFEIMYISENRIEHEGRTVKVRTFQRDTSTVANGAFGKMVSTVVLRGYVFNGSEWAAPEPIPADGLAASIHRAYSRPFYELQWETVGTEVDWTSEVGELWEVEGAGTGFTGARSVCQIIERDIVNGTTSFQCGPPTFLGLADRLALLVPNRIKGTPTAAGEAQYGFEPTDEDEETGAATDVIQVIRQDASTGAWATRYLLVDPTKLLTEPPTP